MENKTLQLLLQNPEQQPENYLLKEIMDKELYDCFTTLQNLLSDIGLQREWRYYKDGKSWLYKITHKKKTIAWLSLRETYIQTSFYFTEKTKEGIMQLNIDKDIITAFSQTKMTGKLIPLVLCIDKKDKLSDFMKIAAYKIALKS